MFLLLLLFFIVAILGAIAYYREQKKYKGIDKIPGPFSLPFVGNSFCFGLTMIDHFRKLNEMHEKFGTVVRIWPIWLEPVVLVADQQLMEFFLSSSKHIKKSRTYRLLTPWLGTGLLISTGTKWHRRRKILTPAFHFKILEQFVDVFNSTGGVLIEKLKAEEGKSSVNIYPHINHAALDVICETAMGTPINAQTSPESQYIKAVKEYLQLALKREFSAWKNFDCLYKHSSDYRRREKLLEILHAFTHSVIVKRRDELEKGSREQKLRLSEGGEGYRKKIAFLDLLLVAKDDDGQPLSDEDIREEVDTFMFEGHDTVTSVLSFALYEIARHPEIQDRILKEVDDVLNHDHDQTLTYRHLQEMQYLGMVIKESLRLYPSVPNFQRELEEDVEIGNYHFPKGTALVFNAYAAQRSPKYFPNPEVFDPERFSTDNLKGKNPFTYIPFSAGPRNYIGQKFATLEMKATIAKILMNFRLHPVRPSHELQVFSDSILKSQNGICIRLEHRKRQ